MTSDAAAAGHTFAVAAPAAASAPPAIRTQPRPGCFACGSPGEVSLADLADRSEGIGGTWTVRACRACGCGWLDPRPVTADIPLCYTDTYYTRTETTTAPVARFLGGGSANAVRRLVLDACYGYDFPAPRFVGWRAAGRLLGALPAVRYRLLHRDDAALLPWQGEGRLLDIGSGGGEYLALARNLGWRVHGMDPDPVAAARARLRSGAEVEVGTLETTRHAPNTFDAIVSFHAIEHSPDPGEFLRLAYRLLKPGGLLYVQTPNFASIGRRRFGRDWFPLEVPRHLCLLSPDGLRRLLRNAGGWEHLTVRTLPRRAPVDYRFALAVRRHDRFGAPVTLSRRERLAARGWTVIERLASRTFALGSELEAIGRKAPSADP